MDKLRFYKTSASYIKSCTDSATCNEIRKVVNSVMTNAITLEEAVIQYDNIVNRPATNPMMETIATKKLGKSLREYQDGKLNDADTAKMISSVVTHLIIESQVNESYNLDGNVSELLDVLKEYVDSSAINTDRVNTALFNLGICKEVVTNE